jgi:hypothetical protein
MSGELACTVIGMFWGQHVTSFTDTSPSLPGPPHRLSYQIPSKHRRQYMQKDGVRSRCWQHPFIPERTSVGGRASRCQPPAPDTSDPCPFLPLFWPNPSHWLLFRAVKG